MCFVVPGVNARFMTARFVGNVAGGRQESSLLRAEAAGPPACWSAAVTARKRLWLLDTALRGKMA